MKKIAITIFAISAFSMLRINAQDYKGFEVEIGGAYLLGQGDEMAKSGGGAYLEPRYNINNHISVGLRLFNSLLIFERNNPQSINLGSFLGLDLNKFDIGVVGGFSLTVDYNFLEGVFRPFVGIGAGTYWAPEIKPLAGLALPAEMDDITLQEEKLTFEVFPRVGFEVFNAIRLTIAYSFVAEKIKNIYDKELDHSSFLVTLGISIGGGKKR